MSVTGPGGVSEREAEVLEALREHLTNAEISRRLHISVRTVESHVSSLLRKLGAADRRALVGLAAKAVVRPATPDLLGMPVTWTSFVGRHAELAELTGLLGRERLVTVVGPGGVGKTRLALEAARLASDAFPAGGAFVDLVPVGAEFVVQAAAAALGVVERPPELLAHAVHDRLRIGRSLLVLDNCEHLVEASGEFVEAVLSTCPDVVVLATSRERFGLTGERVVQLRPLSVDRLADGDSEAEQLFRDRAGPGLALAGDPGRIEEICRQLDGVPLAIELAAARSSTLGLDGLLAGLGDHLRLLARPTAAGERHGSLRSVVEWSHRLLEADEAVLWRRLSVFAAAFDLAAASEVAGEGDLAATSDIVGRLTDKNLLERVRGPGPTRWRFLETMRAFARERLVESAEADEVALRHLRWAAAAAELLEAGLERDDEAASDLFDALADDFRRALATAPPGAGDGADFRLALALGHLCYARRFLAEGRVHLANAAARAPDDATAARAYRIAATAAYAEMRGEAYELFLESATRAAAANDSRGAAIALCAAAEIASRCPALFDAWPGSDDIAKLVEQARAAAGDAPDLELSASLAVAQAWSSAFCCSSKGSGGGSASALSTARQLDDPVLLSSALDAATVEARNAGEMQQAAALARQRLALLDRMTRHDPRYGAEVVDSFHMATETSLEIGDIAGALQAGRRSLEDRISVGLSHLAAAHLVPPLVFAGEFDEALERAEAMLEGWRRAGRPKAGWMVPSFLAPVLVCGLRGDTDGVARWWAHTQELEASPKHEVAYVRDRVLLHLGIAPFATTAVEGEEEHGLFSSYARSTAVELAAVNGEGGPLEGIADGEPNPFTAAQLARAEWRLTGSIDRLERSIEGFGSCGARFEHACSLALHPERSGEGRDALGALGCPPPRH